MPAMSISMNPEDYFKFEELISKYEGTSKAFHALFEVSAKLAELNERMKLKDKKLQVLTDLVKAYQDNDKEIIDFLLPQINQEER